jgi:threonine dehydrogenase-like Zn-dependent dehydrogenase
VVADINIGCGHCYYCRRNELLNCPEIRQLGIHTHGAFAQYVAIPARLVIPIGDEIADSVACLTEPFSCVVRASKKIGLSVAESVVVIGAGPVGNMHIQMARLLGAAPIIAVELNPQRAELARQCGADSVITDPERALEQIKALTEGRGADVVIESVGHPELYQQALTFMRPGGRLLAFGLTDAETEIAIKPLEIILKEQRIQGSVAGMGRYAPGAASAEPSTFYYRPVPRVRPPAGGYSAGFLHPARSSAAPENSATYCRGVRFSPRG